LILLAEGDNELVQVICNAFLFVEKRDDLCNDVLVRVMATGRSESLYGVVKKAEHILLHIGVLLVLLGVLEEIEACVIELLNEVLRSLSGFPKILQV
jgi:hypothetical protein